MDIISKIGIVYAPRFLTFIRSKLQPKKGYLSYVILWKSLVPSVPSFMNQSHALYWKDKKVFRESRCSYWFHIAHL